MLRPVAPTSRVPIMPVRHLGWVRWISVVMLEANGAVTDALSTTLLSPLALVEVDMTFMLGVEILGPVALLQELRTLWEAKDVTALLSLSEQLVLPSTCSPADRAIASALLLTVSRRLPPLVVPPISRKLGTLVPLLTLDLGTPVRELNRTLAVLVPLVPLKWAPEL